MRADNPADKAFRHILDAIVEGARDDEEYLVVDFEHFESAVLPRPSPTTRDGQSDSRDNDRMEAVPRPELDAKLATIEAKMDGRLARIEDRFNAVDQHLDTIARTLESQRNTAWKAAGATIVAIIATVFAAGALIVSSFDSGRETASMVSEAERRIESTVTKAVSDIQAAVRTAAPPPSVPAPSREHGNPAP